MVGHAVAGSRARPLAAVAAVLICAAVAALCLIAPQEQVQEISDLQINSSTFTVIVNDANGEPVEHAEISVDGQVTGWTNEVGWGVVTSVPVGEHTLLISSPLHEDLIVPFARTDAIIVGSNADEPASFAFELGDDMTPPSLSIGPHPEYTNEYPWELTWSLDEEATVVVEVDGVVAGTVLWPETSLPLLLEEGRHRVWLNATDLSDNIQSGHFDITADRTPPAISWSDAPVLTRNRNVSLTWSVTDDVNLATVSYRLDVSQSWSTWSGGAQLTNLQDGQHTVYLRAADMAGNEATDDFTFTVDTVMQSTIVFDSINEGDVYGEDHHAITWYVVGGEAAAQTWTRLDDGPYVLLESGNSLELTDLADGHHVFSVKAADAAGNEKENSIGFWISVHPPTVQIISPVDGASTNAGSVRMEWDVVVQEGRAYSVKMTILSPSQVSGIHDNVEVDHWDFDVEGYYNVRINVTDSAGLTAEKRVEFWIDWTPPTVTIASPSDGGASPTTSVTLTWSVSGEVSYRQQVSQDGVDWMNVVGTSYTFHDLPEGATVLRVRAIDAAGNQATAEARAVVDTIAPRLEVGEMPSLTRNRTLQITWTAEEENPASLTLTINGQSISLDTSAVSYLAELNDGSYSIQLVLRDAAGHVDTASFSLTVDSTAPTVSVSATGNGTTVGTRNVTVLWSADEDATFRIAVNGVNATHDGSGTLLLALSADGQYVIVVEAEDAAGNVGNSSISLLVDTTGPAIILTSPSLGSDIVGSKEGSFAFFWGDSGGNLRFDDLSGLSGVQYSLDGGEWQDADGTAIAFSDLPEGVHYLQVRATDSIGNVNEATIRLVVDRTAPQIDFASPGDYEEIIGTAVNVTLSIEDQHSQEFGIKVVYVIIDGRSYSTVMVGGPVNWTIHLADLGAGGHWVRIVAEDAWGNSNSRTSHFNVTPVIRIASPESDSVLRPEGDTLQWERTWGEGPVQMSVDGGEWADMPETFALNGLEDGEHVIRLSADAPDGQRSVTSLRVVIDTTPPKIELKGALADEADAGSLVNKDAFEWNISDSNAIREAFMQLDDGERRYINDTLQGLWEISELITQLGMGSLPDGSHTLAITAVDEAGNSKTETRQFTYKASANVSIASGGISLVWALLSLGIMLTMILVTVGLIVRRPKPQKVEHKPDETVKGAIGSAPKPVAPAPPQAPASIEGFDDVGDVSPNRLEADFLNELDL